MLKMYVHAKNWMAQDEGATATEYGILVAVIAFVLIVGALLFGEALSDYFARLGTEVGGWNPTAPGMP